MSISRNKTTLLSVALILPFLFLAAPHINAAEGQKEKAGKPVETRQNTQPKSTKRESGRSDRIFVPKEKISAGKPVSFPTDI